jgi:hypothetical protein
MKTGIILSVLLVSSSIPTATGNEIGWDPGMRKALAASLIPGSPLYRESCPSSPTGRCWGTIPAGGGFYTLPIEVSGNMIQWGNYFRWVQQEGEWIARLELDSRNYPTTATPNQYMGMQLNVPFGDGMYTGLNYNRLDHAPPSQQIDHASLEFRAVICPRSMGEPYFGTLHYYSDGYSTTHGRYSLAFNYGLSWNTSTTPEIFKEALTSQGAFMRKMGATEQEASVYDTTIFIDAHRHGMLPMPSNNSAVTVSCNADINTLPFKQVTFDVGKFFELIQLKGIIANDDSYRYAGGIIAGFEFWGRVKVTLDVRRHTMRDTRIAQDNPIPEGKFKLPDNSLWYSNGSRVCQYISLIHAGVYSAHDITRIFPSIPPSMPAEWCPGYDTLNLF